MRAVEISRFGGPEVLVVREKPAPALPDGGVRVKVRAAGVNFADIMMRIGLYPEAGKPPFVPGYEFAGEVVEGALPKGTRVIGGTRFGGYCDELCVPAAYVAPIPDALSFEEAASIPVVWLTAAFALDRMARVRKGDRVLVESAAGGVGVAAIQLAVEAGAEVVGLTGSPSKAEFIRGLGAREVWSTDDWIAGKGGGRFDVALVSSGPAGIKRAYAALGVAGRVVAFGTSEMIGGQRRSIVRALTTLAKMPLFPPVKLMMANKGVFGLNMLKVFEADMDAVVRVLTGIVDGFAAKKYRTVIGATFPLEKAGEAQEHLRSRKNVGKIVLTA